MRVNYIPRKSGTGVWCYAEKGDSKLKLRKSHHHHHNHHNRNKRPSHPTLVFLHGFGADKNMWPTMIRHIPSSYHCVIVDLPGHGETTFIDGFDEPNIDSYVKAFGEFLEVTGLNQSKIILIGYFLRLRTCD